MRLFVALWPNSEVLSGLEPVLERLQNDVGRQGVRFTKPEKIHLTLSFLGEVDEKRVAALTDSLASGLQGVTIGELSVAGLGAFPDARRPGIVWTGLSGEMTAVHERIIDGTDDFAERPDTKLFRPHLTLARISPPSQKVGRALAPLIQEFAESVFARWQPTEIALVQTLPGGSYEQVATFPLEPR